VLVTAEHYRALIEGSGIGFRPLRPDVDYADTETLKRILDPKTGPEFLLRDLLGAHVDESYEDIAEAASDADVLVTHPATLAAPVVAEKLGLPWASTVLAPLSFFSRYDTPVIPQAPWLKALEQFGSWPAAVVMALGRVVTRSWAAPVHLLRERLGLPRGRDPLREGQHSPHLVLALFSSLLAAPQHDWPAHTVVTGYIVHDAAHGAVLSPELERFLADGEPPVVFTLGSSAVHTAASFYEVSLAAATRLGVRAVLLAGRDLAARLAPHTPAHVLVLDAAPHSLLFPRASVIVQQGGAGTLGQALRAGRPLLTVPFANDQPDNAHRAHSLGVGLTVYPPKYEPVRVASLLRKLVDDPEYARTAARFGEQIRAERGAEQAADALERTFGMRR
jgi:UDP:flavonoid glycosyltransferase YjiC (YdhE family)